MTKQKNEIVTKVTEKVTKMQEKKEIRFPENYSPENALKSAYLVLQGIKTRDKKPALDACSQESIANSLLDMVVQGLSPAKKQCYFIPYGKSLICMRSYFGTMAITKRLSGVQDIRAEVVREGETFKFHRENGRIIIDEHSSTLDSLDNKIVAAYCCIIEHGTGAHVEIMTRQQIGKSWSKAQMKNPVHRDFEDQMCKRSVINRACKYFANTSDDSDLLIESYNRTTANEYERDDSEVIDAEVEEEQATQEIPKPKEPEQTGSEQKQAEQTESKPKGQETAFATHSSPGF